MSKSLTLATQTLKKNTRAHLHYQTKSLGLQTPETGQTILYQNDARDDVVPMADFLRQMVNSLVSQIAEHGGMTADLKELHDHIFELMVQMKKLDASPEAECRPTNALEGAEHNAIVAAMNHQAAQLLQTDLDKALRIIAFR
jgi:predicted RNA-binding Zn ribbon-like protein